jgi:hypothetical protein
MQGILVKIRQFFNMPRIWKYENCLLDYQLNDKRQLFCLWITGILILAFIAVFRYSLILSLAGQSHAINLWSGVLLSAMLISAVLTHTFWSQRNSARKRIEDLLETEQRERIDVESLYNQLDEIIVKQSWSELGKYNEQEKKVFEAEVIFLSDLSLCGNHEFDEGKFKNAISQKFGLVNDDLSWLSFKYFDLIKFHLEDGSEQDAIIPSAQLFEKLAHYWLKKIMPPRTITDRSRSIALEYYKNLLAQKAADASDNALWLLADLINEGMAKPIGSVEFWELESWCIVTNLEIYDGDKAVNLEFFSLPIILALRDLATANKKR